MSYIDPNVEGTAHSSIDWKVSRGGRRGGKLRNFDSSGEFFSINFRSHLML
jgi:hypothetical protein